MAKKSIILMALAMLFIATKATILSGEKVGKSSKKAKTEQAHVKAVDAADILAVTDSVAVDSVVADSAAVADIPPVPQDRTDTIYYNKNWKVTSNKAFANYYRLALYPADTTQVKEFKTFYITGETESEGYFISLGKNDDKESVFDDNMTTYYRNGNTKEHKTFKNGLLEGEYTCYYENGNVKEHSTMNAGKKNGLHASFTEDGKVCRLTPYKDDVAEGFYVVTDADGNYSKYSMSDGKPVLETPKPEEIETEYKNGVAWPYYNKNGLIVGVSNLLVDEIGDYREISVFLVNKSMINVDIDPAQVQVYSMKKDKRKDLEIMSTEEFDKRTMKQKKEIAERRIKNKVVVENDHKDNINSNLGAQVFNAGTSNTLKEFQKRICSMKQLEDGSRMKYSERQAKDLGYLERTTVYPGEMVSGYLYTDDKKVDDLFVKVTISGIDYIFEWKETKK